jgi:hypothetical protein
LLYKIDGDASNILQRSCRYRSPSGQPEAPTIGR